MVAQVFHHLLGGKAALTHQIVHHLSEALAFKSRRQKLDESHGHEMFWTHAAETTTSTTPPPPPPPPPPTPETPTSHRVVLKLMLRPHEGEHVDNVVLRHDGDEFHTAVRRVVEEAAAAANPKLDDFADGGSWAQPPADSSVTVQAVHPPNVEVRICMVTLLYSLV